MQKLVLLYGGRSTEHEISVRSASQVLGAIDRSRFDPIPVGIRRDGAMRTGPAEQGLGPILSEGAPVADLRELGADVVFPLLHGPYGEDGRIQGALETSDLPYVGCGVVSSALCMDKALFKHVARAHGIPVVPGVELRQHELGDEPAMSRAIEGVERAVGYPCFVKPANQGSSIGVSKASERDQLYTAIRDALQYDSKLVVERGLEAREIEVAVMGNGDADTIVSQPGEIVLPPGTWYDYDNKYENDVAGLSIPAQLPAETTDELRSLARRAFEIGECQGLARIDFLIDRNNGGVHLNEINTMPGFTTISMYPKLMQHAGISYPDLITRLCELGLQAAHQRARLRIDR